ncbi:hypothetical protein MNB_ARC-1_753 [hydrothermal vent metagenome]|uniref:Haem-binding domain-containing protein n=1 Tax=hydrothermal vent metagenome TaxID=652676 RepID=A0A3B1DTV7_9ZZZZ
MKLLKIFVFILLSFQLIQVDKTNPKYSKQYEIKASKEVMSIFKRACWDCHSNQTIWPWYSNIAPLSWEISRHVKLGRSYLNFSIWETYTKEQKLKKLEEIYRTIYAAMPPKNYIKWHEKAKISKKDIKLIRDWTKINY